MAKGGGSTRTVSANNASCRRLAHYGTLTQHKAKRIRYNLLAIGTMALKDAL